MGSFYEEEVMSVKKTKGRTCHPECADRKYCVPAHAALCKAWHDERRKAREAKNKKERARRAAKKAKAPEAETQAQA
jgi:hypothetical protein